MKFSLTRTQARRAAVALLTFILAVPGFLSVSAVAASARTVPFTGCIVRNFGAGVHGGVFTEEPGGPVLVPNERLQDGQYQYHVSDLSAGSGPVTFRLHGDPRRSGQVTLNTTCPAAGFSPVS